MDILELGKTPIPGAAPQGQDPKYEPAYGVMQDEIRKLSSLSAGTADWAVVVTSATEVLRSVAKDIPAAVYLAVALAQTEGLSGWARGTQICADILKEYWDTAFPPLARVRARTNSVDWWKERSLALLESWSAASPYPWQEYAQAQAALDALDAQIAERMPDLPPLFDVRDALRRVPAQAQPEEKNAAAADVSASGPVSSNAATPATAAGSTNPERSAASAASAGVEQAPPAIKTPADAGKQLHQLAGEALNLLCGPTPSPDPLVWKIVYASLFGKMAALPPAEAGTTAIPPPDAAPLAVCRSQMEAGNHLACVGAAVAFAPASPLWLDIQHCVALALEAAGPDYANALYVVRHECANLQERLPGLSTLTFADGTPFADPATQSWLAGLLAGGSAPVGTAEETLAAAAVAKAGTLSGQGNVAGALETLEEAARAVRVADGLACLRLRLQQVRLLCRETRFDLATSLAAELRDTAERFALEQWQQGLALEVWQAVYTAFAAQEGGLEQARTALSHITRLSPAVALRMDIR